MAGMSRKEIARLLDHIEPQGVKWTRTTKGVLLRFPDGKRTAMLHFTGSDVREQHNVRAELKRAGVTWPGDDAGPLPDWIAKPVTQGTLDRAARALADWPQRYVTGGQLSRQLVAMGEPAMNSMTTQAALYQLGWIPTGARTARKWMRPLELEPDPVDRFPEPEPAPPTPISPAVAEKLSTGLQAALEPDSAPPVAAAAHQVATEQLEHTQPPQLQLVGETDVPPVRQHPAGREFIDTADSWTARPDQLPEGMTVAQLLQVMRAFGLDGEFRVWRDDA